jgi:hypothetical protein
LNKPLPLSEHHLLNEFIHEKTLMYMVFKDVPDVKGGIKMIPPAKPVIFQPLIPLEKKVFNNL